MLTNTAFLVAVRVAAFVASVLASFCWQHWQLGFLPGSIHARAPPLP